MKLAWLCAVDEPCAAGATPETVHFIVSVGGLATTAEAPLDPALLDVLAFEDHGDRRALPLTRRGVHELTGRVEMENPAAPVGWVRVHVFVRDPETREIVGRANERVHISRIPPPEGRSDAPQTQALVMYLGGVVTRPFFWRVRVAEQARPRDLVLAVRGVATGQAAEIPPMGSEPSGFVTFEIDRFDPTEELVFVLRAGSSALGPPIHVSPAAVRTALARDDLDLLAIGLRHGGA